MSCTSDHTGKRSQGRLSALMGGVTACILCVAPLWGGPAPQMEIVLVLMGVPGGARGLAESRRIQRRISSRLRRSWRLSND